MHKLLAQAITKTLLHSTEKRGGGYKLYHVIYVLPSSKTCVSLCVKNVNQIGLATSNHSQLNIVYANDFVRVSADNMVNQ